MCYLQNTQTKTLQWEGRAFFGRVATVAGSVIVLISINNYDWRPFPSSLSAPIDVHWLLFPTETLWFIHSPSLLLTPTFAKTPNLHQPKCLPAPIPALGCRRHPHKPSRAEHSKLRVSFSVTFSATHSDPTSQLSFTTCTAPYLFSVNHFTPSQQNDITSF